MRSLVAFIVLLLATSCSVAGDWPQWLGPNRDGSTTEKVGPWKDAPKVLWKQPVGEGHSGLAVADGKVFVHAKVKDKEEEELIALDAATGKPLWNTAYKRTAYSNKFGNGPRATPTVDGGKVYTFGVTGLLTCFDVAEGKQVWQVDTLKKFEASNLFFGMSCSPLIDGDNVLVNVGAKGASIVAFDKAKGDTVWKSLDDKASYASPALFGKGKDRQIVFLTAAGLVSLKPDGSELWKFPLVDALSESSTTPVKVGDLVVGSSVTYGSVGVKLETVDGKQTAKEAWKNPALTCYFATPVAVGTEYLYMVNGAVFPPSATLRCVEVKTGKEVWSQAKVGKYHASLLRTGNDNLLMLDDAGNLMLVEPNAKEYKELAKSKICGPTWAHPALANGKLYVRDHDQVLCVQLPE
jgi:outer membrane protein assembly factor BamB